MERHFSTGVSTIVALMAAQRAGFSISYVAPDGADEIHFVAGTEATLLETGVASSQRPASVNADTTLTSR
jgi:hypothetical protein